MINLKHATPRPWTVFQDHLNMTEIRSAVPAYFKREIATVYCTSTPRNAADAALIVHAVNAHDELVAVLRSLVASEDEHGDNIGRMMRAGQAFDAARAVLSKLDATKAVGNALAVKLAQHYAQYDTVEQREMEEA